MKTGGVASILISMWIRSFAFAAFASPVIALLQPPMRKALEKSDELSTILVNPKGSFMNILEQITHAFTSHLTMIILVFATVAILQALLDAYTLIARESSKAVYKFTYTSAMGETVTVDSSKPLEVIHLRGLISTCNAHPEVKHHGHAVKKPMANAS